MAHVADGYLHALSFRRPRGAYKKSPRRSWRGLGVALRVSRGYVVRGSSAGVVSRISCSMLVMPVLARTRISS
jgi:hypothetical protein